MTPLHIASFYRLFENVDVLLTDMSIDINAKDLDGNTPLHIASMKGHYEIIWRLKNIPWCQTGAVNNFNKTADEILTPTSRSIQVIFQGTVRSFTNVLGDGLPNPSNESILHVCAKSKAYPTEKARLIVSRDQSLLMTKDMNGFLPIHIAAEYNNAHILEYLARECALNCQTKDKQTALHIAASKGNTESVKILLQFSNLKIHSKDLNGNTAAHRAAENDYIDTLSMIEKSPYYVPNITNALGKTPYDLCPTINSLKTICNVGSAQSIQCILRTKRELLEKPFVNQLFGIVLNTHIERILIRLFVNSSTVKEMHYFIQQL